MYEPLFIANNLIERGKAENISITPMKLQKILYFVYRNYLQESNIPLFAERFATWKYGPVLTSVYSVFYGADPIKDFYRINGKAYKADENNDLLLHTVLDSVWNLCKKYDGVSLSKMTHRKGSAWYVAYNNDSVFLHDQDIKKDKVEIKYE